MSFTFPPPSIAALLLILSAIAAAYDLRFRRIPNWLTAPVIVLALCLNTFLHPVWPGLSFSLTGLLAAFAVYFALYALRAMGSGDVKLMTAIGAMAGWENWLAIFIITALLGGVAALALVTWRRRLKKTLWNVAYILSELKNGRPAYATREELDVRSATAVGLPHGAVIATATVAFLAATYRLK